MPSVDELVEQVRATDAVAFRRLGSDHSQELIENLRERFESIVGGGGLAETPPDGAVATQLRAVGDGPDVESGDDDPGDDDTGDDEPADVPEEPDAEPVDEPEEELADEPAELVEDPVDEADEEPVEDLVDEPAELADDEPDEDLVDRADEEPVEDQVDEPADLVEDLVDGADDEPGDDLVDEPEVDLDDEPADEPVDEPANEPVGEADDVSVEDLVREPVGVDARPALKQRLGLDTETIEPQTPLAELLKQAKSVQIEAALAGQRQRDAEEQSAERMIPPRLASLEAPRLAMTLTFAGVAVVAVWMVSLSSGSSTEFGRLTGEALLDLNRARRIFVGLLLVAVGLVPLWSWAASIHCRRAGVPDVRRWEHRTLLVVGLVFVVGGSIANSAGRHGVTMLFLLAALVVSMIAALLLEPYRYWFGLRSVTLFAWVVTLPLVVIVAGVGGLTSPIEPDSSIQVLAFVTMAVALGSALVTVFVALSSIDLEDEIRLSPSLAVPASEQRHRR